MPELRTFERRNFVWAIIALLGIAQFIVVIFYVGYNYPEAYKWHRHFISDLGRTVTVKGLDNSVNSQLFANSSLALGVSILPFLLVYPALFESGRLLLRILAVMTAVGLIGIGQTPYDVYFIPHHVALVLWVIPMTILAIALPILVFREGYPSLLLIIFSATLFVAAIAYAAIGSHSGYVIMQKIVVLVSLGWFAILASSVVVVIKWVPSNRQRKIAAQAAWYDRKLRKSR